jgi:RNA polymerase sigma-70 factor (ECF subfamily)
MKSEPASHAQHHTENANNFARAIVSEYQGPLTRYATRLLGDADRARDVVQDTFMRLMERPLGEVGGHMAEWLFTVCRHRALDILRKEARMSRFEEGQIERVAADDPRPGRALEHEETHAAMLRLIDRLPASQQEVIRLKFQNGFSYKEISRITALSVNHVGVLIHNAVQRLRADFAAQKS